MVGNNFVIVHYMVWNNIFITHYMRDMVHVWQGKILRVLQLWQKNGVFPPDTLAQLLDITNAQLGVKDAGTGPALLGLKLRPLLLSALFSSID